MARISYEESFAAASRNSSGIGFFGLADDGNEAVVRILHDSPEDFDIVTVHDVQINDRTRKVDCLRTFKDPISKCPFCDAGYRISQRFFIHLLQYDKNETTGEIEIKPMIWERSTQYATTLKNLINEYGPLSDCVFKIRRNGAKGDLHTTYSIMYGNPNIYKEEYYPKDATAFDNYSVIGQIVFSKTPEEMNYYLENGTFEVTAEETPKEEAPPFVPTNQIPATNQRFVPPQQTVVNRPQRFY